MILDAGVARMVECWEDDVPDGTHTDFRRAVKAQPDEKIIFSWFEYPDRAVIVSLMVETKEEWKEMIQHYFCSKGVFCLLSYLAINMYTPSSSCFFDINIKIKPTILLSYLLLYS